jgi:hypothetical protein
LRRKKCDEGQPACTTCTSRNITCHGYGDKPAWKDGGEREKEQIKHIKKEVQKNIRRRRAQARLSSPNGREDPQDNSDTNPGTGLVAGVLSPVFYASEKVDENISIDGTEAMPERITSYRKAELLMHYMDYVFPLQFRFHTPDVNGRGWLLWLLVKTGPLYHAALSLSALHQSIYFPNVFGNAYAELARYHAKALRDLQEFLQHLRISDDRDEKSRLIEVMSCGVSLISFEVGLRNPYHLLMLRTVQAFPRWCQRLAVTSRCFDLNSDK